MYSEKVSAQRLSKLESLWRHSASPTSLADVPFWVDRLSTAVNEKKEPLRPLLPEEQAFIKNELILSRASWRYWAERYAKIVLKEGGTSSLYPLLGSQEFVLSRLAALEEASVFGDRTDGLLLNVLKAARQVGISTLAESIIVHRTITDTHVFSLLAASVPEDSSYLFSMYRRMLDNLPWWMQPGLLSESNTYPEELTFDSGAEVWVGAGKSMKGATGQRGQLGRGRTVHLSHLTELSSWEAPEQIRGSLLPTLPISPRTFSIFESTAKGRGGWWHSWWKSCRAGNERFTCVYIPWYVEPTYARPAPSDWTPSSTTLAHAKRIEETSPTWAGRKHSPSKEQLFWYESTRRSYEDNDELSTFLEEYGSVDDDECFQNVGRGVFSLAVRNRIREQARPLLGVLEVLPTAEVFPATPSDPNLPLPPGLGFRTVPSSEWKLWKSPEDAFGRLLIWELPQRGERYVITVDVADGVGLDRSIIEVLRVGTLERSDEEVAQFASDSIDAIGLAAYVDPIGRFYGEDGEPGITGVEANNHGIATLAELKRHFGYLNHFIWQHEDARDPRSRFTRSDGWYTTRKTRPMILSRLLRALTTLDPLTGTPDCRVNSPLTQEELADFHTEGALWEAEAAPGTHDDTILALAIAVHIAQTLHHEDAEPLDEQRRRLAEERLRKGELAERFATRRDYQNTDSTAEEQEHGSAEDEEDRSPAWGVN